MDYYVFGTHEGAVPAHLIGTGQDGHRIRAVAPLTGGEHDIFYAVQAPHQEAFEEYLGTITDAGTTPTVTLPVCEDLSCLKLLFTLLQRLSWMPPYECLLFVVVIADGVLEVLGQLVDELGEERVAAVTDGQGRFLVEIGGDDWDALERAHQLIAAAPNVRSTTAHRASGRDLVRST